MKFHFPAGLASRRTLRVILAAGTILLLVAALAWALSEPLRAMVAVPLEYMAWLVRTIYLLVPRYFWWVLFLVFAYIIALNGLLGKTARIGWLTTQVTEFFAEPRVARLARYVRLRGNPFYHHRLNHQVTEVALRVLAYQHNSTLQQARLAVSRNTFDLPPQIAQFLRDGLPPWPDLPASTPRLLDRLFPSLKRAGEPKVEAEQMLDFLEDTLEVPHDNGY